jgi:hypothetical protein
MAQKQRGNVEIIVLAVCVLVIAAPVGFMAWQKYYDTNAKKPQETAVQNSVETDSATASVGTSYKGAYTTGGNFQTKIPNGWKVRAGAYNGYNTTDSYLVLLAGPDALDQLQYDINMEPTIAPLDGFGWDGLTEHFYIVSQEGSTPDISQYSSQEFTFDDGTKGREYTRTIRKEDQNEFDVFHKNADSYNQHIYEYKKNGIVIRAYLHYYSNTTFDVDLAKKVIRSIR